MDKGTLVITGGMGGVGQAAAKRLAQDGFIVAILCHSYLAAAKTFAASLGVGHSAHQCDITDPAQVASSITAIHRQGTIFGCVHTAASPLVRKNVLDLNPEEFIQPFSVDVLGGFNVFKAIAPILKEAQRGVIIALTTMYLEPNHRAGRMGAYVPSKFALRGLLRELSAELAPSKVRVNAIAPSMMKTQLSADLPERLFDFVEEKNPMRSLLTPEVLAGVISFLCSDDAVAITGVSLPVAYGEVENL